MNLFDYISNHPFMTLIIMCFVGQIIAAICNTIITVKTHNRNSGD